MDSFIILKAAADGKEQGLPGEAGIAGFARKARAWYTMAYD